MKQLLPLLLLLLTAALPARAYDCEVGGLCYDLNNSNNTASVTYQWIEYIDEYGYIFGASNYKGAIEIPSSIEYNGNIYAVTAITSRAFHKSTLLTRVIIPSSVTFIGSEAFLYCTALTSVSVPDSVTHFGYSVFKCCSSLKTLAIPNGATNIDSYAFSGCTSLTSITIPNSVTSIGDYAFKDCTALTSVTIPNSVISIGIEAFKGCTRLKTLTIPESVTELGTDAFANSAPLVYLNSISLSTKYSQSCTGTLWLHQNVYNNGATYNALKINCYETIPCLDFQIYLAGADLNVNPYFEGEIQSVSTDERPYTLNNGVYRITGLQPCTTYTANVKYTVNNGEEKIWQIYFTTNTPHLKYSGWTETQTTATIQSLSVSSDASVAPSEVGISYNGRDYIYTGQKIILTGLTPDERYTFVPYAIYNGNRCSTFTNGEGYIVKTSFTGRTKPITINAKADTATPTSTQIIGSCDSGDATIASSGWVGLGVNGDRVTLTALTPGKTHTYTYAVTTKEGNKTFTQTVEVKTPKLALTTLAPKCVNSSCAIVAATTNMADGESHAGFQWKKYDAPADMAPSEAYAPISNGMLEGYIKNLQSTSYYKVRAFYKSADGSYTQYGDWITFDPSDFSFFEPTVRTYPVQEISANSAVLCGYALAGTDAITNQGFEYWAAPAQAAPGLHRKAPAAGVTTVECSGQVMQLRVSDLKPGTDYVFRTFVVTEKGTAYGDEQTFTTEGEPESGLESVEAGEVTVKAYYNTSGVRLAQPARGINIVVYSDGTTRKIYVR